MIDGREKQTTRNKLDTECTVDVAGTLFKLPVSLFAQEGNVLEKAQPTSNKLVTLDYSSLRRIISKLTMELYAISTCLMRCECAGA